METGDREEALEEEKAKIREIVKQLPYAGLSLEGWGEERLLERFHSKKWEELYRPCPGLRYLHLCMSHLSMLRY